MTDSRGRQTKFNSLRITTTSTGGRQEGQTNLLFAVITTMAAIPIGVPDTPIARLIVYVSLLAAVRHLAIFQGRRGKTARWDGSRSDRLRLDDNTASAESRIITLQAVLLIIGPIQDGRGT